MANAQRTEITVSQVGTQAHDTGASIDVGDVVAGRYEIEAIAGEGGMAVVLSARHLHLNERFAVKVMRREFAVNPNLVSRFLQEARAAAQLKSDHVCKVFDVGMHGSEPFMVMELLQGEDLRSRVERLHRLPVEEVVEFVIQTCEALTEAHAVGLIHRDIKPDNLFLTVGRDGWRSVKLLDFGISKLRDTESVAPTLRRHIDTKDLLGTPHYMAPECIRASKDASALSDVWSLGVVLYELLSASLPFNGDTVPEISASIIETDPIPLTVLRADLPPALCEIVHWCLAKQPELRVSSAAELATQLVPFAPRRSRSVVERTQSRARARGEVLELPPSQFPGPMLESDRVEASPSYPEPLSPTPTQQRRDRFALATLAVLGFTGAVGATYWISSQREAPAAAVQSADEAGATQKADVTQADKARAPEASGSRAALTEQPLPSLPSPLPSATAAPAEQTRAGNIGTSSPTNPTQRKRTPRVVAEPTTTSWQAGPDMGF